MSDQMFTVLMSREGPESLLITGGHWAYLYIDAPTAKHAQVSVMCLQGGWKAVVVMEGETKVLLPNVFTSFRLRWAQITVNHRAILEDAVRELK